MSEDNVIKLSVVHQDEMSYEDKLQYHMYKVIDMLCDIEVEETDHNLEAAIAHAKTALWFYQHVCDEL